MERREDRYVSNSAKNTGRRGEGTLAVVLVLALLGLLVSLYLNHLHYKVHTDPSYSSPSTSCTCSSPGWPSSTAAAAGPEA